MDILRDNEEKVLCPYNKAHYIRKGRMDVHLKKCRNSYKESEVIVICDFNAAHRIPQPELQYHHDKCPDRKNVELHVFAEEKESLMPPEPIPAVVVPVDSSWDDEEVPSYDPKKYCEQNPVLRRIDTESAAKRRDFRIAERHRFSNLTDDAKQDTANKKPIKKPVTNNLPPTPVFSHANSQEAAPVEVAELLQRITLAPKVAVIPKPKK